MVGESNLGCDAVVVLLSTLPYIVSRRNYQASHRERILAYEILTCRRLHGPLTERHLAVVRVLHHGERATVPTSIQMGRPWTDAPQFSFHQALHSDPKLTTTNGWAAAQHGPSASLEICLPN